MDWKSPMVVRAKISSGTFTSIAATRIVSDFAKSSRAVVINRALAPQNVADNLPAMTGLPNDLSN